MALSSNEGPLQLLHVAPGVRVGVPFKSWRAWCRPCCDSCRLQQSRSPQSTFKVRG